MVFLGFFVVIMVGGIIYNVIGVKKLVVLVFICYLFGFVLIIIVDGFWGLLVFIFLIGFVNGVVEVGCNLLIVEMYFKNIIIMLNCFYVWFFGGIVIGVFVLNFMLGVGLNW